MENLARRRQRLQRADELLEAAAFRIRVLEQAIDRAENSGLPSMQASETLAALLTSYQVLTAYRNGLERACEAARQAAMTGTWPQAPQP